MRIEDGLAPEQRRKLRALAQRPRISPERQQELLRIAKEIEQEEYDLGRYSRPLRSSPPESPESIGSIAAEIQDEAFSGETQRQTDHRRERDVIDAIVMAAETPDYTKLSSLEFSRAQDEGDPTQDRIVTKITTTDAALAAAGHPRIVGFPSALWAAYTRVEDCTDGNGVVDRGLLEAIILAWTGSGVSVDTVIEIHALAEAALAKVDRIVGDHPYILRLIDAPSGRPSWALAAQLEEAKAERAKGTEQHSSWSDVPKTRSEVRNDGLRHDSNKASTWEASITTADKPGRDAFARRDRLVYLGGKSTLFPSPKKRKAKPPRDVERLVAAANAPIPTQMEVERLRDVFAKESGVTARELASKSRSRRLTRPRKDFIIHAHQHNAENHQIASAIDRDAAYVTRVIKEWEATTA